MARPVARRGGAAPPVLPDWIRPQLTELVDAAPEGDQWLHEIKYDGYRMHARLDRGAVRLLTRTGLDWTHKYPAIATAVASLPATQAYLDGELCGVRPDGIPSFSMIQAASDSGNAASLVFFLFDLLYLDGEDLKALPLIERKTRLAALLSNAIKLGRDKNGGYWLLDMVRARANPGDVERLLINIAAQDGNRVRIGFGQDPGQAGKSQALHLVRALSGFTVSAASESGDKITRLGPFSAQCRAGNVKILRGAWNEEVFRVLEGFPDLAHDDEEVACSGALEMLNPQMKSWGLY